MLQLRRHLLRVPMVTVADMAADTDVVTATDTTDATTAMMTATTAIMTTAMTATMAVDVTKLTMPKHASNIES